MTSCGSGEIVVLLLSYESHRKGERVSDRSQKPPRMNKPRLLSEGYADVQWETPRSHRGDAVHSRNLFRWEGE